MKVLVFFILGLSTICISGCDYVKNRNDKGVEIATHEVPEENVIVKASTAEVAEEPPIVESTTRSPVPIDKRTTWMPDDIDLVGDMRYSDTWKEHILDDWHALS